jgi:hypothetical protein
MFFVPDVEIQNLIYVFLPYTTLIWYKSIRCVTTKGENCMTVYSNDMNIMLSQAEIDKLIKQMEAEKEKNS